MPQKKILIKNDGDSIPRQFGDTNKLGKNGERKD